MCRLALRPGLGKRDEPAERGAEAEELERRRAVRKELGGDVRVAVLHLGEDVDVAQRGAFLELPSRDGIDVSMRQLDQWTDKTKSSGSVCTCACKV